MGKGRRPATLVPPPEPSPSLKRRAGRISYLRDAVWSQRWLLPMLYVAGASGAECDGAVRFAVAEPDLCVLAVVPSDPPPHTHRALELIAYGMMLPIATVTITDYFAEQSLGHSINCDSFTKADKPQACITVSAPPPTSRSRRSWVVC